MRTLDNGVTVRETVFREISAVTKSWGWARLLIDEETGRVVIVSDYGEWSYCWRHHGTRSILKFLTELNSSYMGEKMLGSGHRVPSDERTIKEIRRTILRMRKDGELDKQDAAKEWELVQRYADGWIDFRGWCDETESMDCPWEYRMDEVAGHWESFWKHLWEPHLLPALMQIEAEQQQQVPT